MREWVTVSLGDISTQRKGINYKSEDYSDQHTGHPFITIKCFAKGGGYEPTGIKFYDGFFTKADQLNEGDVLFSVTDLTRAGDIVGSPLKVPSFGGEKPALASMDCMRIEPLPGRCDKDFLYQRLMLSDVRRKMVAYSAGSTVLHLDTKKVPTIRVAIPANVSEQKKLAAVLATIDTAIEKTEALIEKYQQIKTGLMHDLFTRGVLPNGQLRSKADPTQTKYGLLPNHWRLGSLLEASDPTRQPILTGPFGADLGVSDFVDDGVPVLRIGNVQQGRLDIEDLLFVTNTKARLLARYRIKSGDLLFARQGATTGRNALADDSVDGAIINYHIIRVALDATRCAPKFVEAAFACEIVKRQVERDKGRGTREGINTAQLTSLAFPLAPLNEQRQIAEILESHADLLTRARAELQKLRHQKLGLMQDLLTGKVPVKVGAGETAHD